jgi:hypothetical protein
MSGGWHRPATRPDVSARLRALAGSPAALVAAGILLHMALYAPALPLAFTFDDRAIILEDPAVRGEASLAAALGRPYFVQRSEKKFFRPVTLLSLGLDARLFGLRPSALRLENLLWAGVGAGLFAWLVRRLGFSSPATWAVLALVSVHPVRSEPVIQVVGRGDLLAFVFVVASLLLALAALGESRTGASRLKAAASAALLLAGLLSKECAFAAAAFLPVVLLAGRLTGSLPSRLSRAKGAVSVGIAWATAFALTFLARHAVLGGFVTGHQAVVSRLDNQLVRLPGPERVLGAISLLAPARDRLLWPTTLSVDYGPLSFSHSQLLDAAAVASGSLTLLAALGLAVGFVRRVPFMSLGLAWTVLAYVPFANLLFPTDTAFGERLLYAPSPGVVLAAVAGAEAALLRWRWLRASYVLALAALVMLMGLGAARIARRIPEWTDDRTLFTATVRDVPHDGRAWFNLAVLALSDGNAAEASRTLRAALAADPELEGQATGLLRHARELGRQDLVKAVSDALGETSALHP